MAIRTMSLGEALKNGYEVIGPDPIYRTEATGLETAAIIGLDVIPAIIGGIAGGLSGPGGALAGGAAGSALGNYLSQDYRISRGLQEEIGLGELGAATVLGGIPLGNVAKLGKAGAVAARGAQGSALATGELLARTYVDEDRAPTQEEIATTLLFGGVFGGTLGAVEAKFLSDGTGVDLKPGMTRPEVKDAFGSNIKDKGGVENASVGNPLLNQMSSEQLYSNKNLDEVAGELLQGIENKLLQEVESSLKAIAKQPLLDAKSFTTPTMERGALESFSKQSFTEPSVGKSILGDKPLFNDAPKQIEEIQKAFDSKLAQQDEIFRPIMAQNESALVKQELVGVQRLGDTQRLQQIDESIARLDHKFGKGKGANKQRTKLAAEKKMVLKRNNMEGVLNLQDAMRGNQGGADQPTKAMNFTDRPMKEAGPASKVEKMADEKLGSNYEKLIKNVKQGMTREYALIGGTAGAATLNMFTEDEESDMKQAGFNPMYIALLLAGGMGVRQFSKFRKTAAFKRTNAQAKANPSKVEPIFAKEARVAQEADRIYKEPSKISLMIKDVMDIAGDVLTPISRQAKNIGPFVAKAFRDVDLKGLKRKAEFKRAAHPFLLSVNKLLKNDKVALEKFHADLNTQNFDGIRGMLDEKKVMHKLGKEFEDTINTLGAIRAYGREEGGIDVGFLERYFPRQVKDYPSLRKFMDEDPEFREATTSIDQAFAKYAEENKMSVENLTNQERSEITSRVLAGNIQSNAPGNTKARSINDAKLYEKIKGAYADPLDALDNYIDSMVDAVEKRKFLGQVKSKDAPNVGAEGSLDTNPLADIGMRADISDTLADKVAKDMLKGEKYSEQDVQKLRSLIQSRFGGVPVSPAIQGLKNANYIQVMTNFGSAITQLGDLAFSTHFNGMGNTFKSLFKRKDVYDFTDSIGLSGKDYDTTNSSAFLGKTLDTLFTATGLKKLDQLGKNTFMNSAWRKYHNLAKKDTQGLADELTPYFGKQRADEISVAVRDNAPNSKSVPQEVEELVFHKLLDVAPATASEMPALYTRMGKGRIFYMLKSFTLKQLDAYREAGADEIFRGIGKYNAATTSGERLAAAKQSGKGLAKLAQLAAIFAAANASTDVIKDTLAGRPTKKDELLENNIWKLIGLNRYTYYNAKRQGVGKAAVELMLPPTAVFDRLWTDVQSTLGDEKYKGAMLQGTPLDLIYWRYLGGLDKINNTK